MTRGDWSIYLNVTLGWFMLAVFVFVLYRALLRQVRWLQDELLALRRDLDGRPAREVELGPLIEEVRRHEQSMRATYSNAAADMAARVARLGDQVSLSGAVQATANRTVGEEEARRLMERAVEDLVTVIVAGDRVYDRTDHKRDWRARSEWKAATARWRPSDIGGDGG